MAEDFTEEDAKDFDDAVNSFNEDYSTYQKELGEAAAKEDQAAKVAAREKFEASKGFQKLSAKIVQKSGLPPNTDLADLSKKLLDAQNAGSALSPEAKQLLDSYKSALDATNKQFEELKKKEKDPEGFLKKNFPELLSMFKYLAAFGIGYWLLNNYIKETTGCYQFSTTKPGPKNKVGCSQENCSCDTICDKDHANCCATPSCTNANGINYVWSEPSALDAIFGAFTSACTTLGEGFTDLLSGLKPILVYLAIGAGALIGIYILFKVFESYLEDHKEEIEVQQPADLSFFRTRRKKL